MNDMEDILNKLSKSKFRSSFHLNKKMKDYVNEKGIDTIKDHAFQFVNSRLRPKEIKNDGKQTPMRQVHPVFISQHATATCCRGCLEKWHKIPKGRELTDKEVDFIVSLIIAWIRNEFKRGSNYDIKC